MDSDLSEPATPTTEFPGDTFSHPPKRRQRRQCGPPPTVSSQSWNSPNFWSHFDELHPKLEFCETSVDENGDAGYQILVTTITPSEQSASSNEYAYYHEKKKSEAKLSTNPVTVREPIPTMKESIAKSKKRFEQETQTLRQALETENEKVLSSETSSASIMKEISKNRLAFSIRLSQWMRQKSALIEELARVHLWSRCVHASVANGHKFSTKWKKLTGFAVPTSRPALFKRTADMLVNMKEESTLYDTSLALAFFELMLFTSAHEIFCDDYWIQTLAMTHVSWIQTSYSRLLHPNVLLAILRTECGEMILAKVFESGWEHDRGHTRPIKGRAGMAR